MDQKMPNIPPETMRYLTIGIEFIAIFAIFLAAGILLDRKWDTAPIFTVIGMVVGFAGSMYRILSLAQEHGWGTKGPRSDQHDQEDEQ